jgi:hypothetical protein
VNKYNRNQKPLDLSRNTDRPSFERRRVAQIVHDDRDNAVIEWRDAPRSHERQRFEIDDTFGSQRGDLKLRGGMKLELRNGDTFDPYDRKPDTFSGRPGTPGEPKGGKRDLKKLSEWLEMMRTLEERKKKAGSGK